jgi:hypothetical protein
MAHRFFNNTADAVLEAIEGLVATQSHLQRLDGFPQVCRFSITHTLLEPQCMQLSAVSLHKPVNLASYILQYDWVVASD